MTATIDSSPTASPSLSPASLSVRLVNGVLAIKPIAQLAKQQARSMMIKRAEAIGVQWRQEVKILRSRSGEAEFSPAWLEDLDRIQDPNLRYPAYYTTSFHAYDAGNLDWEAAMEVEVAARAVHAKIWAEGGAAGDALLRQSYHAIVQQQLKTPPQAILDLGCSVGMSTMALQAVYPEAQITGLDLSPYFLAIAQYRAAQRPDASAIEWRHAAAEQTGLAAATFDLVSAHLVFHELPQSAAIEILQEARRLLRPGGHLAIMDMNPRSEIYAQMPPYILTLLKSTEPYLDDYFALDLEQAIEAAGFAAPMVLCNSPRHRTVIAQAN